MELENGLEVINEAQSSAFIRPPAVQAECPRNTHSKSSYSRNTCWVQQMIFLLADYNTGLKQSHM